MRTLTRLGALALAITFCAGFAHADIVYSIVPRDEDDGLTPPWAIIGGYVQTDGSIGEIGDLSFINDWSITFTTPGGGFTLSNFAGNQIGLSQPGHLAVTSSTIVVPASDRIVFVLTNNDPFDTVTVQFIADPFLASEIQLFSPGAGGVFFFPPGTSFLFARSAIPEPPDGAFMAVLAGWFAIVIFRRR